MQMVVTLSEKLEGVIKLHHAADREDEVKCCSRKDGKGVIGINLGKIPLC